MEQKEQDDIPQATEHHGKTSHDTADNVEQSDTAQDAAGETLDNEQQEVGVQFKIQFTDCIKFSNMILF